MTVRRLTSIIAADSIQKAYGKPVMKDALGFIETRGWVTMVEAIDAMTKTAQVEFLGWQQVGGGLVTGGRAG